VDPRLAVDRGYAVVVQDVRGRGGSGGEFEPYVCEADDGYDSVEWVADQQWCDGRVVMGGMSYVGMTQWLAASAAPPSLVAIAPALSGDTPAEGWSFRNGVLERGFLASWLVADLAPVDQQWLDGIDDVLADPQLAVTIAPWSKHWFTEPPPAAYWQERSAEASGPARAMPKLSVGGWYDIFLEATLRAHTRGRSPWDRLIIGPWGHDSDLSHLVGDRNLGGAGHGETYGIVARTLDFYDAVLAGREPDLPPVSAYVLGADRWVALPSWPPPGARRRELALGTGTFTVVADEAPPTRGGRALLAMIPGDGFGPRDQRPLADRGDVLALCLPALEPDCVLAGPVVVRLRVAPGVPDAERDWVVTLCLRCSDDRWDNLTEGIARVPADVDEVVIPLGDVCVADPAGARLVVLVAGASFPRWDQAKGAGPRLVRDGSSLELTVADI
jgi:predicted acyl esterase